MTAKEARDFANDVRLEKTLKSIETLTEWCQEVVNKSVPASAAFGRYSCRRAIPEKVFNLSFGCEEAKQFITQYLENWGYDIDFNGSMVTVKW